MDNVAIVVIFGAFFVTANQTVNWLIRLYDRGRERLNQ